MWYKIKHRGSIYDLVRQYDNLVDLGYRAMIGPESSIWVNDVGEDDRTHVMLSLRTENCTVEEYATFSDVVKESPAAEHINDKYCHDAHTMEKPQKNTTIGN